MKNKILEGVIWKQLLMFFFPIFLGSLFQQLYSLADSIVVGNFVGTNALAAIDATTTLSGLFINFFVGVGGGASVIISQYFGSGDFEKVKRASFTAILLSVLCGIFVLIIGTIISPYALELMNVPSEIIHMSIEYIKIYFLGAISLTVYNVASGVLRATGDSKTPFYILVVGAILNIFLDILFVAVFNLGVAGAAIATVIAMSSTAILSVISLFRKPYAYRLEVKFKHFSRNSIIAIIMIGIPLGLEAMLYDVSNIIIRSTVNTLGTNVMAAWGVLGRIDAIVWMILNAFGIALTTFVGQNYGAGNIKRVKAAVRSSYLLSTPTIIVVSILIILFIEPIALLFVNDAEVIGIVRQLSLIICPYFILFIPTKMLSGTIRGTGESLMPMLITFFGSCLLRVIWIVFMIGENPSIEYIFYSYPVTWFITSAIFVIYYKFYQKKKLS